MIIDHKENFELPSYKQEDKFEEKMVLARISEGLFWIYNQVKPIENRIREGALSNVDEDGNNTIFSILSDVNDDVPLGILSCAFQWYAVSVFNYCNVVGWLKYKDKKETKKYVRKVLPRISIYRNKVAGHLAFSDPRGDNAADLIASKLTQIIYMQGFLCAATLTPVVVSEDGTETKVKRKIDWSLTLAHEKLSKRYWPNGPIKSSQPIKMPAHSTKTFPLDWSWIIENNVT